MKPEDVKQDMTVWIFDRNRRVYAPGDRSSRPIYREHFAPRKVVGSNKVSWLLSNHERVSKKDLTFRDWNGCRERIYDQQDVEDACWVHDNRYRIIKAVEGCRDPVALKQIDALLATAQQGVYLPF